ITDGHAMQAAHFVGTPACDGVNNQKHEDRHILRRKQVEKLFHSHAAFLSSAASTSGFHSLSFGLSAVLSAGDRFAHHALNTSFPCSALVRPISAARSASCGTGGASGASSTGSCRGAPPRDQAPSFRPVSAVTGWPAGNIARCCSCSLIGFTTPGASAVRRNDAVSSNGSAFSHTGIQPCNPVGPSFGLMTVLPLSRTISIF